MSQKCRGKSYKHVSFAQSALYSLHCFQDTDISYILPSFLRKSLKEQYKEFKKQSGKIYLFIYLFIYLQYRIFDEVLVLVFATFVRIHTITLQCQIYMRIDFNHCCARLISCSP